MSASQQKTQSTPERSRQRIDGVELSLLRQGKGPTLICLHAVGHDAEDFSDFSARFADRYEVIALDWPPYAWPSGSPGGSVIG
jgi:pimeloyl-ACP methyl ester carboxylesterase